MIPKFRAWDKVNGEMIPWNRLLNGYNLRNVFMRPEMCGLILMQYTGLVDKNGVEIFEGDILRFKFKNETRIGFVECVRSSFLINAGEIICNNKIRHSFSSVSSKEHEIIGNIYENNDLIEVLK